MKTATTTSCNCITMDGVTVVIVAGCENHDPRNKAKSYEVTVTARGYYRATVTANSPEEAIELAIKNEDWELGYDLESLDDYEAEEIN